MRKGTSYISDINDQAVQDGIGTGFFRPVSDYSLIGEADAVIICVPTPLNDDAGPDLNYVKRAAQLIGAHLKKGSSSCWKARHIRVRQETSSNRSWKKRPCMREGFYLAYSPERVDPGNQFPIEVVPKVVGGATDACLERCINYTAAFMKRLCLLHRQKQRS
ncbi:hypothetical protein PO124_16595 [Bacillus licheniformis]|nr:hypothetical protein [Bacillus licheniformis]